MVSKLPKALAIISVVIIGISAVFLLILYLPAQSGSYTSGGQTYQTPPPQVCDINLYVAGSYKDGLFIAPNTVTKFSAQTSVSNCRVAVNKDFWGIFKAPAQYNIFPTNFALRADIVGNNGVVQYTTNNVQIDVPIGQVEFPFTKQTTINGVLQGSYQIRIYSTIGFDGSDPTSGKTLNLKVPP